MVAMSKKVERARVKHGIGLVVPSKEFTALDDDDHRTKCVTASGLEE